MRLLDGPAPHAVFRCDASPELGGGHLQRCLTLARALSALGWQTTFAMHEASFAAVSAADFAGAERLVLHGDTEAESDEMAAALGAGGADVIVVDHYKRDHRFEAACRAFAAHIAVIDDLADRRHDADLLLDQTLGRTASDYRPLVPQQCRLLCGPRHALLRDAFARRRRATLARRRVVAPVRRILIAMGAADSGNLTSVALDAFCQIAPRLGRTPAIDIVLGASSPHLAAVRRRLEENPAARVHVGVRGEAMAALMADADLAIGAGGTTSWERCCLGLPSVVVVMADNQATIAANLDAAGACRCIGATAAIRIESLAAAVGELCRDAAQRLAMSKAAAAVCDGLGTASVVAAIENLMEKPDGLPQEAGT